MNDITDLLDEFVDDMRYLLDKFIYLLESSPIDLIDPNEVNEIIYIYEKYFGDCDAFR